MTISKFDTNVGPWLRLLTPLLIVLAMFILNDISKSMEIMAAEIKAIGSEQAKRTIMVYESYQHQKDRDIHYQGNGTNENTNKQTN